MVCLRKNTEKLLETLMGKQAELRFQFIQKNQTVMDVTRVFMLRCPNYFLNYFTELRLLRLQSINFG